MTQPFIPLIELNGWKIQLLMIALAMIFVPAALFVRTINRSNEGPIYQSFTLLLSPIAIIIAIFCFTSKFGMQILVIAIPVLTLPFLYISAKQDKYDAWVRKLLRPEPLSHEAWIRSQEVLTKLKEMHEAKKKPQIIPVDEPPK